MIAHWILRCLVRAGVRFPPFILCYHSITRPALSQQLRLLTSNFRVVRLEDVDAAGANAIAFTMDDCRRQDVELWDEMTAAFEIPATLFVPVRQHQNESALWPDQLRCLLANSLQFVYDGRTYDCSTPARRAAAFEALVHHIYRSPANTEAVEHELDCRLRKEGLEVDVSQRVAGPRQLSTAMKNPRLSLGSHSMTHAFLVKSSEAEVELELASSRDYLKAQYADRFVAWFCFPYGSPALIGDAAMRRVSDYYDAAVVLDGRPAGSNPHRMGRIAMYDKDTPFRLLIKILRTRFA